jgi:hypothetical protein
MEAPFISTIIAIGLIPVAFLFVHAFLSGLKEWRFHPITGVLAILWDLSMSIGYMIYRSFGGEVEGSVLEFSRPVLFYFIIHGSVAFLVILLEFGVLITGIQQWKRKETVVWHRRLAKPLFVLWWFAFITGEIFYIVAYII